MERLRAKQSVAARREQQWQKGQCIISCRRQQFNHYAGQKYAELNLKCLASGGWKHSKSKLDYFTINATHSNPAFETDVTSFEEFGFEKQLCDGIAKLNYTKPTNVQAMMIPLLMQGQNVLCAAETGSGKTLAFLLPMVDKLLRYRAMYGPSLAPNRPLGVILTPSRELAEQIYDVARSLSEFTPFAVDVKCGGRGTKQLVQHFPQDVVDVLVSTPGVFSKLLSNKLYDLSRLSHIVLDEADTLLDDSFNPLTIRVIQKLKVASEGRVVPDMAGHPTVHGTQIAFVGATMPRNFENILRDIVPVDTIETVTTSHLHRLMPHVPQKFIRAGVTQRPDMLLAALKSNVERRIPTLVFCNKSSTVCFLGYLLDENKIDNIILHANMPETVRNGRFAKFQNGDCDILVCSDVASRGLDTIRARHVINYEFPNFMSDYVHRIGRIGRVGSAGACFALSYICYKWDVELLWKIETSARVNCELHNVNANIKRKLVGLNELKQNSDSGTNFIDD
jgi:superfamily II DNA/RNA helicase